MAESDGGGGDFASILSQNSMANKNRTLRCTFSAPSHSACLLQGLSVLRARGQLLDVELSINDERFHVHKAVLASCSDYFRAMFTGGMRESNQDTIELKGLSARGLKHIIDFAYSSEVTLDLDCIQDVLGAAVFLQMVPVVELCEEFLKSAMSVETCLHIGQMATTFSLSSLKESVDTFTFRHFLQISEQEDFLHIPMERLVFFLQSNKLKNCSEIDLFHAAIRWLQFDDCRRAEAVSSDAIVGAGGHVQKVDIMVEDVQCRQFLLEAFNYQILPFRQHEMQSARTLIRSDVVSLITFGGTPYTDHDRTVSSRVYHLPDISARQFKELTEMESGCSHACVAVLDNFVYIVGGQHLQYRSGEGAVESCFRYDPHLNQWLRIQSMQEARIQFQLTCCTGSFTLLEDAIALGRRIWGHAGTTCADKLFVSGGYGVSLEDKKALHCYDPLPGPCVRSGGPHGSRDRCFDVLAVEYYIPDNDQWTTLSPMRVGQSEAGCCLLDQKIYIIGGYNWHLNNVTSIVQVFNTDTEEWERDLHFPESFAGIACTPIILPQNTQR
ncbi:hypothetical protein WMY93_018346 [Mugilogobius chulae]|uniref:BTB domain-containing protein n=1 Tax=Mugilogobius chulae TaxID=88201 RepID=A0AAW0NTT6_9GOBI